MPVKRAEAVSLVNLAKVVDKAVGIAAERHKVKVEPSTLSLGWEIFGRRLRDVQDFEQAFAFAKDVTRAAQVPGVQVEAAVLRIDRDILCGFIEKGRLPRLITR